MFIIVIMAIMVEQEQAEKATASPGSSVLGSPGRKGKVGLEKGKTLVFTEHSLGARPRPFNSSRHHWCPHFTDEKTEPQEGSSVTWADGRWQRGWEARFSASRALLPCSGGWGS